LVKAGDPHGRLSILPFSDPRFDQLVASVPEAERRQSMHIVGVDGRVASAGDAVIALFAAFPRTRWKAWAARLIPPLRRKIDREYRRLADRRGELSTKVPDVPPTIVPPRATS
jgi:predicted DCC family thiol-disulfide oxidoreductase YuxK